jgi:glycosyltransferase involved in cell wall biosynthesis
MPAIKLSCFIIAKNEADRIERTVRAVRDIVDEVIVIDSGSTDGTQQIAEAAGARVMFNEWKGFGQQKRFGEMQCRNDWLINLDADEFVSSELAAEIRALFANGKPRFCAYSLRINDVYPGKSRPRPWARDYIVPRIYDRRQARFKDSAIHDSVDTGGKPKGILKGTVHHFSARSFDIQMLKAIERVRYNADNSKRKSVAILRLRVVFEFPSAFIRYYFVRRHFTGGLAGFQTSVIGAYSRFARIVRMLEIAERPETLGGNANTLNEFRK